MLAKLARVGIVALGLAIASASAGLTGTETPSALDLDPTGWTDLLAEAGPSLKGWSRAIHHPGEMLGETSQWSLDTATGLLTCRGDGGHDWLRWDQEQGDFVFHVEWKFTPVTAGKKAYNSGIYARNSRDARVWHQAQVGNGPSAYFFGETSTATNELKRFDLSKNQADKRVRPAGEWNTFEITCKAKDMALWVNGEVVNDWHECQIPRGYVGLEAEGYRIEFRNVKLKPL